MSAGARENELRELYRKRDAKFTEIVFCLGQKLHTDTTCLTKMDWERVEEDAEELTDNWAAAEVENRLPATSTELQRLLSEHQQICKRIIDILDAEQLGE